MSESTTFHAGSETMSGMSAGTLSTTAARNLESAPLKNARVSIVSRMLVLFAALTAVKLILLVGQGQSLYEAHWRINGVAGSWLNFVGFYAFIITGGLSLVLLGKSHFSVGLKEMRVLNACVLCIGLIFIFLTLHNGNKNYLYPVLSGVLSWKSLGPYVANSIFFNQPYLGGWVLAYCFGYYVLARTGKEKFGILLTALTGCSYALIYLRELMLNRDELLIIDGLSVVSMLFAWRVHRVRGGLQQRFSASWLLAPLGWTLFFGWTVMRFDGQWQTHSATYFLCELALTLIVFSASTFVIRRTGNSVVWGWLMPFFFAGFLLLTNTHYASSENYNHMLCLAMTFPRYFAGEAILVVCLALCAWAFRKIRPKGSLWWLDVASLCVITMTIVDLRLSQIMGVRLGWDVFSFGDSPKMMFKLAMPYLPGLAAAMVVLAGLYALSLRAIQAWAIRQDEVTKPEDLLSKTGSAGQGRFRAFSYPGALYTAALFAGLAALGLGIAGSDKAEGQALGRLVLTSPLWKRVASRTLTREEFFRTAGSIGLGDLGASIHLAPPKPRRDLNVVVVFMESSYNKHLSLFGSSEETQPLLSKYKDRMELFPNFFSAFAGSIHARFATFTSLYPVSDFHAFTQERVPVKSLFEVLHDQGYTCSMFYSSYFDYTGFRDFLKNRGLDEMYDADTMPGQRKSERVEWGLLEEETLGAIRSQLQKYSQNHQRFCLTYVPAAPHNPYDKIPKPFRKFKMKEVGDFTPVYLNELLYMDWVVASIVDELKASGLLDNTMVVITNDHGEMLGGKEDEHIGHGWAMTPQLANTPLIIMDPAHPGYHLNKTIGTQVDFLPTVLDRLNIPLPEDQLYEGQSLDAPERQPRLGYLNSYKQFGIIDGQNILLGDRESGNPAGLASRGVAFIISNEGPKTIFTEADEPGGALKDRVAAMARFDAFQENLLRNYAYYCAMAHSKTQQLAKQTQK